MENKKDTFKERFKNMSLGSKTQYIWLYGTYIMSREKGTDTIAMYEVDSHLVEVYYSETMDEVGKILLVEQNVIDEYLPYIDISNLTVDL